MKASGFCRVAAAVLLCAPLLSGCLGLRDKLGLPRIAPRARNLVPRPRTVARAARAVRPHVRVQTPGVVVVPAPVVFAPVAVGPAPAPMPVAAAPVYAPAERVALPSDDRDATWQNFMLNPPVNFDAGFLSSQFLIEEQYLAMMGVEAQTFTVNVQHLLANLVLVDAVSPIFNIVSWHYDPNTNTYSITVNADTQQFVFQFVYDANAGMTQAYMTVDGQTVVAWPIVISMGLHQ